jgi:hypothetical protein
MLPRPLWLADRAAPRLPLLLKALLPPAPPRLRFWVPLFACGLFACGLFACGLFACGLFACGLFACGLFACGLFACGLFACGRVVDCRFRLCAPRWEFCRADLPLPLPEKALLWPLFPRAVLPEPRLLPYPKSRLPACRLLPARPRLLADRRLVLACQRPDPLLTFILPVLMLLLP